MNDKHEMFPRLVSYLAGHCPLTFMVASRPTFLVRGVPYVVRTYNLKTRFEEGEEAIFKEVLDMTQTAFRDSKIVAVYDIAGPFPLSGSELNGMMIRYAKVGLEE